MRKLIFCDDINSVDSNIYTGSRCVIPSYAAMSINVRKMLNSIGSDVPVISMGKIERKLFPFLNDKNNTIKNKLTVIKVLENIIGNEEHKLRFQNDIDNVMASIKLVAESGVNIDQRATRF